MAAEAPVGCAVVKSAVAGESAHRPPWLRRKAAAHRSVPLRPPSRLHVGHSVDSAISLAKRSDSLSRATVFFFRNCTVRVLPEVLQNNATQKDDTLRAHQARGKSTPIRVASLAVNAAAETRVEVLPHSPGGSCVFNVVIAEANS